MLIYRLTRQNTVGRLMLIYRLTRQNTVGRLMLIYRLTRQNTVGRLMLIYRLTRQNTVGRLMLIYRLTRQNTVGRLMLIYRLTRQNTDFSRLFAPPRWPSGKVSALRAADLGSIPDYRRGSFARSSHTSDFKIGTEWLPRQALGVQTGSALGLAGPVSVYCDWVRQKV